jgi:hypothetical protein
MTTIAWIITLLLAVIASGAAAAWLMILEIMEVD